MAFNEEIGHSLYSFLDQCTNSKTDINSLFVLISSSGSMHCHFTISYISFFNKHVNE